MAMVRKTMRVAGRETCVALEPAFWGYLAELAAGQQVSLLTLVGRVAAARPAGISLASALRTFALEQARRPLPPHQGDPAPLAGAGTDRSRKFKPEQQALALRLLREGKSMREVAHAFGVHPTTVWRASRCRPSSRGVPSTGAPLADPQLGSAPSSGRACEVGRGG
jgi:predicted DNA-binding ribbon-helix-helix protein